VLALAALGTGSPEASITSGKVRVVPSNSGVSEVSLRTAAAPGRRSSDGTSCCTSAVVATATGVSRTMRWLARSTV
jgi:hypothetical protein